MEYIMPPEMYYSLCNVRGFTEWNGETYKEHIIIIFDKLLDEETRLKIIDAKSDEDALKLIPFHYTHNYQ
jgi:hypothetical protein